MSGYESIEREKKLQEKKHLFSFLIFLGLSVLAFISGLLIVLLNKGIEKTVKNGFMIMILSTLLLGISFTFLAVYIKGKKERTKIKKDEENGYYQIKDNNSY